VTGGDIKKFNEEKGGKLVVKMKKTLCVLSRRLELRILPHLKLLGGSLDRGWEESEKSIPVHRGRGGVHYKIGKVRAEGVVIEEGAKLTSES